ncbi:MAG: helix-turn-helix transcriptional regulator [Bdellovibrionales bacterium]|nr:helix-turn-helix transcriptional regulator [Bdellovibrionales bacterium]
MSKRSAKFVSKPKPKLRKARIFEKKKGHDFLHNYSLNLSNQIERYRKGRNLTQAELARKIGVPQTVISNFESGWANPSLGNLIKLSQFFGVSIDELISEV